MGTTKKVAKRWARNLLGGLFAFAIIEAPADEVLADTFPAQRIEAVAELDEQIVALDPLEILVAHDAHNEPTAEKEEAALGDFLSEQTDKKTGPAEAHQPEITRRLRRLKRSEINVPHMLAARDIIRAHKNSPYGTEIELEIEGTTYVARVERHFHPVGGPVKPWGAHPGISLFAIR